MGRVPLAGDMAPEFELLDSIRAPRRLSELISHSIVVHLFATQEVPEQKQRQAQDAIQRRSGRSTQLSVSSIASQSQLAEMMDRLSATPAPAPPAPVAPPSLEDVRAGLIKRVIPVLSAIWPAQAPLAGFDIVLRADGVTLDARYQSERDLTPIAVNLITKQLQDQLKLPTLTLDARRVRVPRKASRKPTRAKR